MALGFPVPVRNAIGDALIAYCGNGAILKIFKGTRPPTGTAEVIADKLSQLTFTGAIAPPTANGVITLNVPPANTSAFADGTASWARITKADGTTVAIDMSVTATGGGGDLQLDSTAITQGGTVAITAGTITVGNA
jgi:hypothetical protein